LPIQSGDCQSIRKGVAGFADFLRPGREGASREAWPDALKTLTEAAGVAGAALIISNKSTGNVEEACFSGLSAEFKSDYVEHYAALDPYSPLLDGSWKKLSECIPDPILRSSERYNDFVLTCGVRDILGGTACRYARLSPSSSVFISRSAGAFPQGSIPSSNWRRILCGEQPSTTSSVCARQLVHATTRHRAFG